jgi:hypothetical protein
MYKWLILYAIYYIGMQRSMYFVDNVQPRQIRGIRHMEDLKLLEMPDLLDMLAERTIHYSHRMSEGMNEEDYEEYNITIGTIQKEIMKRKEAEEG